MEAPFLLNVFNLDKREIPGKGSPTGVCAMLVKNGNVDSTYYVYTDHLGSITGITDANNVSKDKRSYDAWGRLRDENWSYPNVKTRYGFNTLTDRGYTAHEEMNEFNLVNMNGRVYDPLVGAMLQPDVVIQDAGNSQSYNRYSYCRNNPLRYSDPSGYSYINYGFANAYQAVQQFLWKNNAIYLHVNGKRIRYSDPLYASIDRQSAFAFQIGGGLRPKPMPEGNVNLEFSHVNETVARDRNRSERRAAAVAGYMAQGGGVPSGDWNHRDYDAGGDGNSPGLRGGGDDEIFDADAFAAAVNSSDVNSWAYEPPKGSDNFNGVSINDSEIGALRGGGAFTIPYAGIFVSKSYYADKPDMYRDLLRHEFGHSLQYEKYGVFYFGYVASVSIWSASNDPLDHQYNSWTEIEANTMSFDYFGHPNDWNHKEYPTYGDIFKIQK